MLQVSSVQREKPFTEHITAVSGRGLILANSTFLTHKKERKNLS